MNRVLAAARLQLVHPLVILGVPWMIGVISFAINWATWRIVDIRSLEGDDGFTGGVSRQPSTSPCSWSSSRR